VHHSIAAAVIAASLLLPIGASAATGISIAPDPWLAVEVRNIRIENLAAGTLPAGGSVAALTGSPNGFTTFTDSVLWGAGSNDAIGLAVVDGGVWVVRSDVTGGQGNGITTGEASGVLADNSAFVRIRDARVFANTTNAIRCADERNASSTIRINNTLLGGPVVGSPNCVGVYDASNAPRTC